MATQWDESADFVIVGSGGGSMCAALLTKERGKKPLIIEKLGKVGGSSGFSGGAMWIPNNPVMKRSGLSDSYERARQYFDAAVTYQGKGSTPERRETFLRTGPEMVEFLERKGLKYTPINFKWPDYYDNLPGGEPMSRSLVCDLFDINELGEWKDKLSLYPGIALPMGSQDFPILFTAKRTWAGKLMGMKLVWRMLKYKLLGKQMVANGGAMQGRMLQIALREDIPIWTETPVEDLIIENGRVVGVIATRNGKKINVQARGGVLINAGGFARNAEMRQKYQPQPSSHISTSVTPGDTGEVIQAAINLGAAIDCMDEAWWVITSRGTDGTWPEGSVLSGNYILPFMHHLDLSMPYSMMVDQNGERFCDEAGAYMEIGQRMYQRHKETGKAVPSWVVMDARNRKWYPWGTSGPGINPQSWFDSGYMKKAETLDELANICGIDSVGLKKTVERFNGFCRVGVDEDYGRGCREFDRCHGDPTVKPNPSLGPIEQGPFYAVAMYPGDVGTAGGVITDQYARVLKEDGSVIPGLYATGNSTASVMGRTYPAAGASIGPSFVFGYVAAKHATGATAA